MSWRQQPLQPSYWREVVHPVKQEVKLRGTVSYALLCQVLEALCTLHVSAPGIKEQEVVEDLVLLVQQLVTLQGQGLRADGIPESGGNAELLFCQLLSQQLSARHLKFPTAAATIVSVALRRWADGGQGVPGARQLQIEALSTLSNLLQDNFGQIADHERVALLALLMTLTQTGATPSPSPTPTPVISSSSPTGFGPSTLSSDPRSAQRRYEATEPARLALYALSTCLSRGSNVLGQETAMAVLHCTLSVMQAVCSAGMRLVEDAFHSRFYATLLRTLNTVIVESKRGWVAHSAAVVECLRKFMMYGTAGPGPALGGAAPSSAEPGPASAAGPNKYKPPHKRGARRASQDVSDSDASDSEFGGSGGPDRFKSSKVRLSVLMVLQSMAKSDSRALHPYWTYILPVQQPLAQRPLSPHLITLLLYDPVQRVRSMAAATISSMLEGPSQRSYMAVAEAKSSTAMQRPPVRGFTTLSASLGALALSLHVALLHAAAHEPSLGVLSVVLRALCVVLTASPYERLPPSLLPQVLQVIRARWLPLRSASSGLHPSDLSSLQAAYLACLAELFSTKTPISGLRDYLHSAAQQPGNQVVALVYELLETGVDPQAVVRIEALGALKGLAQHYSFAIPDVWSAMCDIVQFNLAETASVVRSSPRQGKGANGAAPWQHAGGGAHIDTSTSASTSPEDKAAQHAVKLMGDYLAGVSRRYFIHSAAVGSASSIGHELGSPTGSTPNSPKSPTNATSPRSPISTGAASGSPRARSSGEPWHVTSDAATASLVSMWRDGLAVLIPSGSSHPSYMVRSAALGVFGELPEPVFGRLGLSAQTLLVALMADAAARDTTPAVRSMACKVLGTLYTFSSVVEALDLSSRALEAVIAAVRDAVLSVRISACWALANVCDSYRGCCQRCSGLLTHQYPALQALAQSVVAAVQDVDKVRANGIRAIGNLMSFLSPSNEVLASFDFFAWMDSALTCLQSCMTTGNMKVQWNACYALHNMFKNTPLLDSPRLQARLPPLLLLLVMLVRDSSNFKIRTHAAAALAALPARQYYGDVYPDALLVVASTLETLETGASSASLLSAASGSLTDRDDGDEREEGSGKFPNYKYINGLCAQLRGTLLQLLALSQESDMRRLREPFTKRIPFITHYLQQCTAAVGPGAEGEQGYDSGGDAYSHWYNGGGGGEEFLPADPFGLEGCGAGVSAVLTGLGSVALDPVMLQVMGLNIGGGSNPTSAGGAPPPSRSYLPTSLASPFTSVAATATSTRCTTPTAAATGGSSSAASAAAAAAAAAELNRVDSSCPLPQCCGLDASHRGVVVAALGGFSRLLRQGGQQHMKTVQAVDAMVQVLAS